MRGFGRAALYGSGRQGEALDVYGETRRALIEELGIEPNPLLQRLERAVLSEDALLEAVGCVYRSGAPIFSICREIGFAGSTPLRARAIGAERADAIGIGGGLQRSIESRRRRTIVGGARVDEGRAARSA
jgi:hypothetical protein